MKIEELKGSGIVGIRVEISLVELLKFKQISDELKLAMDGLIATKDGEKFDHISETLIDIASELLRNINGEVNNLIEKITHEG